jgi:hypothetical protein
MNKKALDRLFSDYEKAFDALNIRKSASYFSKNFLSAGPRGVIAKSKKDLLKKAREAAAFYRRAGQTSARILHKSIIPMCQEYAWVRVHWGMTFKATGNALIKFDVSYIINYTGRKPEIILFIAHQDEEKAMKQLMKMNREAA